LVSIFYPEVSEKSQKITIIDKLLCFEQTVANSTISAVRDVPVFGNIIQIIVPYLPRVQVKALQSIAINMLDSQYERKNYRNGNLCN